MCVFIWSVWETAHGNPLHNLHVAGELKIVNVSEKNAHPPTPSSLMTSAANLGIDTFSRDDCSRDLRESRGKPAKVEMTEADVAETTYGKTERFEQRYFDW